MEQAEAEAPLREKAPPDPRLVAFQSLETSFAKRDWDGLYASAEALSRAAYDMGRSRKPYDPMFKEPPPKPAPPPQARYSVEETPTDSLKFNPGTTLFVVKDAGGKGIAICTTAANAELVARALTALP